MKKLFVLVLTIALCLGAWCISASAADIITRVKPAKGNGSAGNPYQIATVGNLYWFADYVNDGHSNACAKLTTNIGINRDVLFPSGDLNDLPSLPANAWTPIDNFSGTFDGDGYTIRGLYLSETYGESAPADGACYSGMFRKVEGGTIKNLHLVDSYIGGKFQQQGTTYAGFQSYVGGICGYASATATIEGCTFSGTLEALAKKKESVLYMGGICGYNAGTLKRLEFSGRLTAENNSSRYEVSILSYGGGICGRNIGTVQDCVNQGQIIGTGYNPVAGGICGEDYSFTNQETNAIKNCINQGEVRSITEGGQGNTCFGGGILGIGSSRIVGCENQGAVTGANCAGGIVGHISSGEVTSCTNSAMVEGYYEAAGGICGYVVSWARIDRCINSATVKLTDRSAGGSTDLGGICGGMDSQGATIVNCYNTGDLVGYQEYADNMTIGGICGSINHSGYSNTSETPVSVQNCCSTGSITAQSPAGGTVNIGGVCGWNAHNKAQFDNCFWLNETGTEITPSPGITALTAEQFARGQAAGYLNRWRNGNGEMWGIGADGYPVLTDGTHEIIEVIFKNLSGSGSSPLLPDSHTAQGDTPTHEYINWVRENDQLTILDETVTSISLSQLKEMRFNEDTDIYVYRGKIELTATVTGTVSKVYDGTASVPENHGLHIALEGVLPDDDVTATASYAYADADVGSSKTITASGITLSGADAGNYDLTANTATAPIGQITAKTLTATVTGTVRKVYDGTNTVTNADGLQLELSGIENGDQVSATASSYTFDSPDVGSSKTITASGITLTGADAGNYDLTANTATGNVGQITPRTVTITAENKSAERGGAMPELTYQAVGFLGSDTLTSEPELHCSADLNTPGTYLITVSGGAASSHYTLTYVPGTLTVTNRWRVSVKFENGDADQSSYVDPGDSFLLPDAPSKSGYAFAGWSDGSKTYQPGERVPITADTTFTAVWEVRNVTPMYKITIVQPENGSVRVSRSTASANTRIVVVATPDPGYALSYITVEDEKISGNTFRMPNQAVEVSAVFVPLALPFTDVHTGAWFYDAVASVYFNGLMVGTSATTFSPNGNMTRAMVWTILARMDGETITGSSWATDARAWAMAKGVSDGTNPDGLVTREQLVTMLWRYAGEEESSYSLAAFTDAASVSDWAAPAMAWAVEKGILTGVTDRTIAAQGTATRAQCAAMLMRFVER